MKIRDIRIDGFGQFADKQFGPLDRPMTVFYGPNESGKSTLLEFVRRVLFGFPRRSGKVNTYPSMAGGSYGGHIIVQAADGRPYNVRRTAGRGYGGEVGITSESGDPFPETELTTLLGHHSRDVFEQIFAFTLEELHSGDLLTDSNVNNQIYSAGMGVTSLPNAMKSIENSRRDIFLKGGSSQKTYEVYTRIEAIDNRLREVSDGAARYGELTARLQQVEIELAGLAARRQRIQARHGHRMRLQNAWDAWNDLVSAGRELEALPAIDNFPADGVNRLEALEERVRTAHREYESARVRMAQAEAEVESRAGVEHEAILRHSSDIRRLQNGRTAFDGSIKDLPERETELEGHKRTLSEALKDLGPDWDEARLEEFDLSIAVRQEIAEHRDRLRDASAEHSNRRAELVQVTTALEEAIEAKSKARREFESFTMPRLDDERIRQRRNLIRAVRSQLDEIGRIRQNVLNLQSQLDGLESAAPSVGGIDRSRQVAAGSLAAGVVLLIGGAVLGGTALLIGAAAAIALAGVAAYLFIFGRPGSAAAAESPLAAPIRESLRRSEAEMQDILSKMTTDAAPLELEVIDESSLLAAEESIDDEEVRLREWTRLSEALGAAKDLAKQRQARGEESASAVEDAERQLDAAQGVWREWLDARRLLDTFSPETVEVLQGQVELGRSRLGDVRSWRERIKAIEKDIDEYVEAVEPLATAFDVTFDRSDSRTVAAAADRLVELSEEVQERVRNRTDAEAELEDAERQLEERRGDLENAEEELGQLLRSGEAEDTEEFRARADLSERRAGLEERSRAALDRLQRISGPGEPLESLKSDLSGTDSRAIADEIAALEEERADADARREELSTERGSIHAELERLMGEEESSRLRMEKNVLLEQIAGHAREWARLTLARNLLEEARRKFERERQPGVVRHAQKFFAEITEGRYRQVYAPLGERTITVTDADGRTKQPSELSRGTREQLFLSLRFGLIRELGQRTEPLPIVVDEVLVNFDHGRALRAAVAFAELSHTNQVLVFTCHPTVVKLFRDAASEAGMEEPHVESIA